MAQGKKVTPIKTKIKNQIEELIDEGWYILATKNQPTLYNPKLKIENCLNSIIPRSKQEEAIEKIPTIIKHEFRPNSPSKKSTSAGFILNTYQSFNPSTPGESGKTIDYWQNFLERLFPIESERKEVEQFLAHMIQKPEERPSYGLMLTSESGTGKGWLYSNILKPLLTQQCYQVDTYSAIFQRHSTVLYGSCLVWIDDPQTTHRSTANKLRNALTEPQLTIEPKHEQQRTVETFSRIILASNDRCPLDLTEHDSRRWLIPQYITHKESSEETKRFIELFSKNLCLDTLYLYLIDLDLQGFDCFKPKDTETKSQILELSKPNVQHLLEEFLEDKEEFHWLDLDGHLITEPYNYREVQALVKNLGFTSKRVTRSGRKTTIWQKVDRGRQR